MTSTTVRDAAFDVLREYGLTTLFANPGSTEISLLADLPDDLRFVLGLHESSVVGMATGWALGRREPALAILHTTPGLGNAVSALDGFGILALASLCPILSVLFMGLYVQYRNRKITQSAG